MNKKIFFDHIQKTAGRSIESFLRNHFGKDNVLNLSGRFNDVIMNDYKCLTGHIEYLPSDISFIKDIYLFTVLRNPIDRILSFFFYNKIDVINSINFLKFRKMDFENFACSKHEILFNNQTMHFSRLVTIDNIEGDLLLEKAKEALNRFNLVGVFHQINDLIDVLCYEISLPPVNKIPHINITSKRPMLSEIDPKIIQRLEELNQLDLALYEYATQLFNEKKRQVLHECIERRHRELKTHSTHLSPSPPTPLPESEGSSHSPAPLPEGEGSFNTPAPADFGNRQLEILTIEVKGDISLGSVLFSGETVHLRVIFRAHIDVDDLTVGIHIHDRFSRLAFGTNSECLGHTLHVRSGGVYFVDYHLRNDLGIGEYTIGAALHLGSSHLSGCFHWRDEVTRFEVVGNIGYHFEGVAKLYPQLRCGVLEGDPTGIEAPPAAHDWPRLQHIAIHTPKLTEFSARLHLPEPPQRLSLHQVISVEAEITNTSSQTWGSTGQRPVHLSYHWQALDGGWLEFNGERTPLPHDLAPGETLRHYLTIKAPLQPCPARLHLTLVQEGVGWFDECGCPALVLPVNIEPAP